MSILHTRFESGHAFEPASMRKARGVPRRAKFVDLFIGDTRRAALRDAAGPMGEVRLHRFQPKQVTGCDVTVVHPAIGAWLERLCRLARWSAPCALMRGSRHRGRLASPSMTPLVKLLGLGLGLALSSPTVSALTCDELREQVERKIRMGGVANPRVVVVDAAASAAGRVVGSCARGSRRIVYLPAQLGGAPRSTDSILTECKDGRVLRGGDCKP